MKYRYRAVERFWTSFYRLPPAQKESVRMTFTKGDRDKRI